MKKTILISLVGSYLSASSALPMETKFVNSDNSSFYGTKKGDEHLNWIEDKNGNVIKYNPSTKNYEYAKIVTSSKGAQFIAASGQKATDKTKLHTMSTNSSKHTLVKHSAVVKIWKKARTSGARPNPFKK